MIKIANRIVKKIEKCGYDAWLVGGAVRDIQMGKDPHDIDIATSMPLHDIENLFDNTYYIGNSKKFGIVVVNIDHINFEVAQLRTDSDYVDGRKPEKVSFSASIEEDLSRRDLTINAMALASDGSLIDPFNGMDDIKNKITRTVGDPCERVEEDYLRMLRAIRFSAKFGFPLDAETKQAIVERSHLVNGLSRERIKDELIKMASNNGEIFANSIQMLDDVGILNHILPEITKLKEFPEEKTFHPESYIKGNSSVFNHILAAIKQNKTENPIINLSILFHDIGKGITYKKIDNKHTFHRHGSNADNLIYSITKRLAFSNMERNAFLFVARNHMKLHNGLDMKSSKIFTIVNDVNWGILKEVSFCDDSCRGSILFNKIRFDNIIKTMEAIGEKWANKSDNNTIKLVDGNHVMKVTGMVPGPLVGKIISKVTEWVVDDCVDESIDELIKMAYKSVRK